MKKPNPVQVRRSGWPSGKSAPLVTPLSPSVVFVSDDPDGLDAQYAEGTGFVYAREGHPNAAVLAQKIDALEGADGGIVTGSGMSAISAVMLGVLQAGDHVVGGNQLYGQSLAMLTRDLPKFGITTSLADPTDVASVEAALRPETRMILIEVVSNPTIRVADVEGIAALAKDRGILLMVDNTFTTPRSFQPFAYGADIVMHSVTKMLAGHSDATLGYVVAKDPEVMAAIDQANITWGLTASPYDCWLAERGLLSFDLRYDRAQENAGKLAEALAGTPGVTKVLYPTRGDHPDHNRAVHLLGDQGGHMLSFEIAGERAEANRLVHEARPIAFAPTLGDIGTTLSHPPSSSHRKVPPADQAAIGISEGFFRVSVGIEPVDQLIEELTGAIGRTVG